MAEDYAKFLIKEYKYWAVYIHQNQGYLGRCVIWCKRDDALDFIDATDEEQKEFFNFTMSKGSCVRNIFS